MTDKRIKITAARRSVLERLAASNSNWLPHTIFFSAAPEAPSPRIARQTQFGRQRRGLPYRATFEPMVNAGLIEERLESGFRKLLRITPAGRAVLADEGASADRT